MIFFELEPSDITNLNDADLREMVARLCEAELVSQNIQRSCVLWGGAQEAADGGLDVRVVDASSLTKQNFVPCKHTGFQVKKNSMSKAACTNEMTENGQLKAVIADLLDKKGAYIIVSGKDDCSDSMLSNRILGMKSALKDIPNSDDIFLDFYGRSRLCSWLRQHPSVALWVRYKLGKPLSGWKPFGQWTSVPSDQEDDFLIDDHPCVINLSSHEKTPVPISKGIDFVRKKLAIQGSVVRITGLSGVGKTRFAQALFEEGVCEKPLAPEQVIYADLGDDLSPTASELISYLIANDFSSYVVLDNCPPDTHRQLQKQVTESKAKLSLLTVEYDISDDSPEETEVVHIEPSSEQTVSKLIQKRFTHLGQVNADRIAEFSGGNARVAIALASRVNSDETLTKFSDEELFKRLFHQRKGEKESLLVGAEVLSLVYSFNTSKQEFNDELGTLSKIGGLERSELNRNQAELFRRNLSQKRGNWRAVLPHALANRLARRALENIDHDEINAELLKDENFRLFKSCAHRLGYLHDCEPARQLALTWMEADGPFHDIVNCDDEWLVALSHIAPVFPDVVLSAVENAAKTEGFCSRENPNFSVFVNLLRKIAYEDQYFNRAAELMLCFAETEKSGEMNNSIVSQLSNLFTLYLSGTQATPERRQFFLRKMLNSGDERQLEIAEDIFQSVFRVSGWMSFGDFDFGARSRGYGWRPHTKQEEVGWYQGFVEPLVSLLNLEDGLRSNWARDILAKHFRSLWSFAGINNTLEEIVRKYAAGGKWPDMWISIKKTIYFNGQSYSPELFSKIQELAQLSEPKDLYSDIEAYALTNVLEHVDLKNGHYKTRLEELHQKIEKLGEAAVTKPEYLERLAPRLWNEHVGSLFQFGKGVAKGSSNKQKTFEHLVHLLQKQHLTLIQTVFFRGFIAGVHEESPELSKAIQESVLAVPELKPYFVEILSATPIRPWGTKKLLELAQSNELEAWRFEQIKCGRIPGTISDDDLSELLSAINDLPDGIVSTIEILQMRLFDKEDRGYNPSNNLRAIGMQACFKLLSMSSKEIQRQIPHGLDQVLEDCLSVNVNQHEIREVINLFCEGVETYRLYGLWVDDISDYLVKNHTEFMLDRVFESSESSELLIQLLFKNKFLQNGNPLYAVSVNRLLSWCDGNQDKIKMVAKASPALSTEGGAISPFNNLKTLNLSNHVKPILDAVEDKAAVIEGIYDECFPTSWSGSYARALEVRSKAFAELLKYDSREVKDIVKIKLAAINEIIAKERVCEAKESNQREQRFE